MNIKKYFVLSIKDSISKASKILALSSETPRLDAELLLSYILGYSRSQLITYPLQQLTAVQYQYFEQYIARRAEGEPIAYITGQQGFWSLTLQVTPEVLIPRPETELLIETILELDLDHHSQPIRVLDLGTGSGAIALALSYERPLWQIDAIDFSADALKIAKQNAERYGVTKKQVRFIQSDWFTQLNKDTDRYDIIVSNPPYVAPDDHHLLPLRYEPQSALVAYADGFEHYISITQTAPCYLKHKGYLLFEHGNTQQQKLQQLLSDNHFQDIVAYNDLNQQPRVCSGRLSC